MKGDGIMRKYSTQIEILRELFNAPTEEPSDIYCSPLMGIVQPWVSNKMRDLLPKQKAGEKNPTLENQDLIISYVLANILEYATPSIQIELSGSSRNPRINTILSNKLRGKLVESLKYITTFHNKYWDKLFIPIFEDFIKLMKSDKDFHMESLSDFLTDNELHDLWLIVATIKDYSDESAEDRFSL